MCTYNFIIYHIISVIIAMLNTISRAKYIMVITPDPRLVSEIWFCVIWLLFLMGSSSNIKKNPEQHYNVNMKVEKINTIYNSPVYNLEVDLSKL